MIKKTTIKDVKVDLGKLIKTYRKSRKLSQQELADYLSVSRITIQNVESGKNFTIDTLLKILQEFELLEGLNKEIAHYQDDLDVFKALNYVSK